MKLSDLLSYLAYVGIDEEFFTRVIVLKGKGQGKGYVFGIIFGTGAGGSFFINGEVMKTGLSYQENKLKMVA